MADWIDDYTEADGTNQRYNLLRAEMARLRGQRDRVEYFDEDAVARAVREFDETVDGDLLVFVANDFGRPRAYRPSGVERAAQNEVRQAILRDKYDDTNGDLNDIRRELLSEHPGIHKAIVVEHAEETIRYHLPEGSNDTTNFLTVREMVGLIDYTTNSFQRDGLSRTY